MSVYFSKIHGIIEIVQFNLSLAFDIHIVHDEKFFLKIGGLKLHRQSIPFFLGLVLGEFVVGSVWSIRRVVFQVPSYRILF